MNHAQLVTTMREHQQKGTKIPSGDQLSSILIRKFLLAQQVLLRGGSPEFEKERNHFLRHVAMMILTHIPEEEETCVVAK
jgi:hypothetical protein